VAGEISKPSSAVPVTGPSRRAGEPGERVTFRVPGPVTGAVVASPKSGRRPAPTARERARPRGPDGSGFARRVPVPSGCVGGAPRERSSARKLHVDKELCRDAAVAAPRKGNPVGG